MVGRRLPSGLPASRPRRPPHSFPTPPPPAALPLLRRTPPPLPACARVLFMTGREDYPDHGLPARSHRGSPGPQSAPSTQTIWGDLRPRFKLREDAKQNKTNRWGRGVEGRVTEPGWHLRPPSSVPPPFLPAVWPRPDTPNFNTRARAAARYQGQGRPRSPGHSPPATPFPKGLPTGQHSHPRPRERAKWR